MQFIRVMTVITSDEMKRVEKLQKLLPNFRYTTNYR